MDVLGSFRIDIGRYDEGTPFGGLDLDDLNRALAEAEDVINASLPEGFKAKVRDDVVPRTTD